MVEKVCVKILFFAFARDIVGFKSKEYILPSRITPKSIVLEIAKSSPNILKIKDSLIVSINQEYCAVDEEIVLSPNDEIAIIPPISGGKFQ